MLEDLRLKAQNERIRKKILKLIELIIKQENEQS